MIGIVLSREALFFSLVLNSSFLFSRAIRAPRLEVVILLSYYSGSSFWYSFSWFTDTDVSFSFNCS